MSSGMDTTTGPGRPAVATRSAWSTTSSTAAGSWTRPTHFVTGAKVSDCWKDCEATE